MLVSLTKYFHTRYAPHLLYASEADYNEPNVDKPGPEVVALVSPQEEISPRPMEVVQLPIKIHADLPAELTTLELVPSLVVMRASVFLKSSDVYDSLQIFLQELVSQEINISLYGLDVSGAELTCHAACILLEFHRQPPICHGS